MLQFLEHMYVRAIVIWVFECNGLLWAFYYFNKNAEDNKKKWQMELRATWTNLTIISGV